MTSTRTFIKALLVTFLLAVWTDVAQAGFEGTKNTFYGTNAGAATTGDTQYDTFIGNVAGYSNTTGYYNTSVGTGAGYSNTTGYNNTSIGSLAGYDNSTGSQNVFLGYGAGLNETGSNKLYIDNCYGGTCTSPLIYGEFDNHLLRFNGAVGVAANGTSSSQLHFSKNVTDTAGGWLTSVLENNFFMSSGATYNASLGGWIQKSSDGNAVIVGSGGAGYRVYTNTGTTVGANFAPTLRLHMDYAGDVGINTAAVAGVPIMTATGAELTAGGVWLNSSSRARKEHIRPLSGEAALAAVAVLRPVTYNYKVDAGERHVGFIAEEVPDLVATKDRKTLSALDIVAVLTKAVQEQQKVINEQRQAIREQREAFERQQTTLAAVMRQVRLLQANAKVSHSNVAQAAQSASDTVR
jgi:hypothetical protein